MVPSANENLLQQPISDHMQVEVTVANQSQTVGQVVSAFRAKPPVGQFFYIYVVDDERRLVGVLPTRALMVNPPETPIASLMLTRTVAIPDEATVLDACEFFIQHRFLALPVVDANKKLLGVVDVGLYTDEIFDLVEQRSRDDAFQLIGIHVWRNQSIAPWSGFRDRFPWLIANFIGGTCCAILAWYFEDLLDRVIALAMFLPIVLTISESVSIQSMSILLQGLHGSQVDRRFLMQALARELLVAALLGAASGVVVGVFAGLWLGSAPMGIALGLSVMTAIVAACMLGVCLPVAIHALKADPQIAAGPIVLATSDVVTLLCYFSISSRVLLT